MKTNYPRPIRVSRHNPCPICEHTDWCGLIDDGRVAICMRVADGAASESANGGYVHVLREQEREPWTPLPRPPRFPAAQPETYLAPIERRHTVYTALLESLTLSEPHADDLQRRGLYDTFIAHGLFASVPAAGGCADLAAQHDLRGVPGFFREPGAWRLAISDWHAGYFVPVRDVAGRVQALQIRRNESEPRYCWLSSKDKADGVTSGAPPHFAAPQRLEHGSVIVTEGSLKADVIAQFCDSAVIGLAGVTNSKPGFGAALRTLGVERVQIAFDADWHSNQAVRGALVKLGELLRQSGLSVSLLDWQMIDGKGLDDLLMQEVA